MGNLASEPCLRRIGSGGAESATAGSASTAPLPVRAQSPEARRTFLEESWAPFLSSLQAELQAVRDRFEKGFDAAEVLFPQQKLLVWLEKNLELTKAWHGRPNMSLVYEFLIEAAHFDGNTRYRFGSLPQCRSQDGYVLGIDCAARNEKIKAGNSMPSSSCLGVRQKCGESGIDNTVLPNALPEEEARFIRAGCVIKRWFVSVTKARQRAALERLGLGLLPPVQLQAKLSHLTPEQRAQAGLRIGGGARGDRGGEAEEPFWWSFLRRRGLLLESFGQLHESQRLAFERFVKDRISSTDKLPHAASSELDSFVSFCREHPGRMFRGDPVLHKELMMAALISGREYVIPRSEMEKFTWHRYLPFPWTRQVALVGSNEEGVLQEYRKVGDVEDSRFRKNDFGYGESHGLGICGAGIAEGADHAGTLTYELGLMIADERAKLGNWFLNDVEKIVREAVMLNPAAGPQDALPGETLHDVGQNVQAASSIGATQHTQVFRGCLEEHPLWLLTANPQHCAGIMADVDLVQVGQDPDAFFLKLVTTRPDSLAIIEALQALRLEMMKCFGGLGVDFNIGCFPVARLQAGSLGGGAAGGMPFAIIFAPVAALRKTEHGMWLNPDTQETSQGFLRDAFLGTSQARGNVLFFSEEERLLVQTGRSLLTRMYDFGRKPGARATLAGLLYHRFGFQDTLSGPAPEPWQVPNRCIFEQKS